MPIDAPVLQRLLDSIEANNLVVLCGAGLSIPDPSFLKSAQAVANAVYDSYAATQPLPIALRDDIDQLAGHFFANGQFESLFINSLVSWDDLTGQHNEGHAAVGDFLLSGAARAALSANFDTLIEQWASLRKVQLRGALNGVEAAAYSDHSSALLKFHGCMNLDRARTLWTLGQISTPDISERLESCKRWMELTLPRRDWLVVGFWTDWGYFNDVLADLLAIGSSASVTVIDPQPVSALQTKAPRLWAILSGASNFSHIQASGNDALPEIREAFSRVWTRKLFALGAPLYAAQKGAPAPASALDAGSLNLSDLYDLRRDAEGAPSTRAARTRTPNPSAAATGLAHLLLSDAADARKGSWYVKGGATIRVVNGAGQGITVVADRFKEPSAAPVADIVVCPGALDFGVPGSIIPRGLTASIVRPKPGSSSRWMTLETARTELSL